MTKRNSIHDTWLLTKAGLIDTYTMRRFNKRSRKERKSPVRFVVYGLLFLLAWPVIGLYYYGIGEIVQEYLGPGSLHIVLSFCMMTVTMATFFMSIYKASSFLFTFKDFDMLASFPIRMGSILASKLIMLYLSNLFMTALVGVPGLVVYGIMAKPALLYWPFAFVLLFFLPIIPILLGSLLSFLLAMAAARFKRSNLLTIIGSIFLMIFIMGLSIGNQFLFQDASGQSLNMINIIMSYYVPGQMFIDALVHADILGLLLTVGLNVLIILAFVLVFSKSFRRINALMTERYSRADYKMQSLKVSSPLKALYQKDLRIYTSSYIYVLNTAIGMVILTIFTVAMLFMDLQTVAAAMELPELIDMFVPVITLVSIFSIGLCCTTAASFSIEGKTLPILKSLPVKFNDIIKSKILVNMTVTIPLFLLNVAVLAIRFSLGLMPVLTILLSGLSYALLSPLLGILANLHFPKLEWKSQVQAVKQSASVTISVFTMMALIFLPVGLYTFLGSMGFAIGYEIFVFALAAIALLACLILWRLIMTVGRRKYEQF